MRARRENFPVATRLLPRRLRTDLLSLYAFARFVDDLGDEGAATPAQRGSQLDAVDADLDRLPAGMPQLAPVAGLAPLVRERGLPLAPLHALVQANRQDQTVTRYPTYGDLLGYCELSANPVGRLVLHAVGAATPARLAWSDDVCTALQLLEHCQDVPEDLARGRVYLPLADLAAHGASEAELAARPTPPAVRAVLAELTERARTLLGSGRPLVASLRGFPRLAVAGFVAGGLATADALARAGYDVSAGPPAPRRRATGAYALRLLREGRS